VRIAAFDLGSNSFHLLVVETRPDGSFVPIVREKEMLRLGDVVAREGRLDEDSIRRAVEVVGRFKTIADTTGATEIVAYGTAALREAANGPEVTDRIEAETGVRVQVVNGIREARLVFEAVSASVLMEPAPVLCADLGGGSLELSVGDRSGLRYATSLHLGVGRLTAELVRSDPPTQKERARLVERVRSELSDVMEDISSRSPVQLIGTSGTFCAIARAATALREGSVPPSVNQLSVAAADIEALAGIVFSLPEQDRARLPGIDARRAELLPAGMVVLGCLLEETGIDTFTTSEWALREGMVLRVLRKHDRVDFSEDPRAIRRASVLSLCRRSNWRERHARAVSRMALQLFDGTAELHGADEEDRELLELAALLHDVGEHVSRDGHSRHTAYLVENAGLRGFSPDEVRMLSCLGRYHTRGRPKDSFAAWEALGEKDRERTLGLLALLRIADGLDSGHGDVIGPIEVTAEKDRVLISAPARGEAELERWMFQRKSGLFAEVFGRAAELSLRLRRHDEFDADSYKEAVGHG
jgi:exopolyphosphatase/guanosine-5'-triphosphate,3'-diphosphate pyrophosphatase